MHPAQRTYLARLSCSFHIALALVVCLGLVPTVADAAYNDSIVLKNGDRLKGEVKSLNQGQLKFKTDTMSTVYIKWDRVAQVTAPETFEVETTDGIRFLGSLFAAGPGKLGVDIGLRKVTVPLMDVVRITLLKRGFWDRIDGSIDLGASYAKSSAIGQGSLSADVTALRPSFEVETSFDTTVTVQPDEPISSRTTVNGTYVRLLKNRWFVPGSVKFERNTDIGLKLRASAAGGFGRYFLQTNRSRFGAAAGLVVTREAPVDGDTTTNLEALLSTRYSFLTHDSPKTTIDVAFTAFPSLNVRGRFRTDLDLTLKRELLKDFTIGFTYYDTYDNKPPGAGSPAHDFGGTVTLGWIF
jgi:hypothetical protein